MYPFVRTPEWYLLPAEERAAMPREHGEIGRGFPDVLANTTSAFGINDWEWILAFEADELDRIVDCIPRLHDAKARLYTKEEVPFVTGISKDAAAAFATPPDPREIMKDRSRGRFHVEGQEQGREQGHQEDRAEEHQGEAPRERAAKKKATK